MTQAPRPPFASMAPAAAISTVGTTLEQHVASGMRGSPGATGEFTSLLNSIALAIRIIEPRIRAAGLAGMLGYTGETNVQGEQVQKLDEYANDVMCTVLSRGGRAALLVSEENDQAIPGNEAGKYVVAFDPLDGSSNIDCNISIGTIFSILRHDPARTALESALQPGKDVVAAGYAIYGSSTMLVLSTGHGVHAFTLDAAIGEFFLSHASMRCPLKGGTYSVNEGNFARWEDPVKRWATWVKADDKPSGRPYGHRYVGSLVADAHRTLLKGGIFAYPHDSKSPDGKLRLLYEANPMAYLFEQAGGSAITGKERILDIQPTKIHQRCPLIIGSRDDVEVYRRFMMGE